MAAEPKKGWLAELQSDMDKAAGEGNGYKVLVQLFLTYLFFCKSLAYSLVIDTYYPLMGQWHDVESTTTNELYTVVRAPWAMKPIWAIISDIFPINGYRKRYYILISVSVSLVGMFLTVFLMPSRGPDSAGTVAFYFFLFVAGTTLCDSMTQSRYTELMKVAGNASVVSFVWFLLNLGGFAAAYNLLLPANGQKDVTLNSFTILLWIAIPLSIPMVGPAAMNWLAEPQKDPGCHLDVDMVRKFPKFFILSTITACIAVGGVVLQLNTSTVTMFGITAKWYNGFYYGGASLSLLVCCNVFLPARIGPPSVYMFICKALYLNIGTILQYYYVANPACFESGNINLGPLFENSYYQTVSGYGGTVASLLGVVLFDRTIQFWNVRPAFWVTTFANVFTCVFDLAMVERWNQRLIGRDPNTNPSGAADQAIYMFGAAAIDRLVDMLDNMPGTVLIGKLCPSGMEAQVFAILAALSNFGSNVAYINGSIVAEIFGVRLAKDGPCTVPMGPMGISNLGWLKLWSSCFLPLMTIPFTWVLLPDIKLSDDILEEADTEMQNDPDAAPPTLLDRSNSKSDHQNIWLATSKSSLALSGAGPAGGVVM